MASSKPSTYFQRDYIECVPGDSVINSATRSYRVGRVKGLGAFGKVAQCTDLSTKTRVAIKFVTTDKSQNEVDMMTLLQPIDPDENNLIRFHESFRYKQYTCLVFELLARNFSEYMNTGYRFSMEELRFVLKQLFIALQALETNGIIHADIKLDNIMQVSVTELKIKLIDFGSAFSASTAQTGMKCQIIEKRAPEVILGVQPTPAIDMWSTGLVAAYLLSGITLYSSRTDYDTLRSIMATIGNPPVDLMKMGKYGEAFFSQKPKGWMLKTVSEYRDDTEKGATGILQCNVKNLLELKGKYKLRNKAEQEDLDVFMDLLVKMLMVDPRKRITPSEALQHDFITKKHLMVGRSRLCSTSKTNCFHKNGYTSDKHSDSEDGHTGSDSDRTTAHENVIVMDKDISWRGSDMCLISDSLLASVNGSVMGDSCNSPANDPSSDRLKSRRNDSIVDTGIGPSSKHVASPDSCDSKNSLISDHRDKPLKKIQNFFSGMIRMFFKHLKLIQNRCCNVFRTIFCGNNNLMASDNSSIRNTGDSNGFSGTDSSKHSNVIYDSCVPRDSLTVKTTEAKGKIRNRIQSLFSNVFRVLFKPVEKIKNYSARFRTTFCRNNHTSSDNANVVVTENVVD